MPKSVTGLKLFTISAFALAMLGGLSGCAEKQPTPKAPAVTVRNPFVDEPVAETEEEAKPETKPETQTEIQPEVSPELRPIPAYPTLQPFDTADSITIEIKNQCAVDVCGSLDTAIPAKEIIEGTKRSKKTASLFANIEPTIADWFNLNHVSQVKQFENFKRHKEALKTLQIEPKYLPLHNLFWTFSSMSKLLVDYNGTNIEDDKFEKALKENFPGENAAVVKAMLEHVLYAKDIASSSMVERIGFYELTRAHLASIFEPVKAIVVSKGVLNPSDEEVHAYYQLYAANELLQSVQRLAKEFPSLPIKPTDGLVKLSQGKDVTSAESSAVSRDYTFSYIYKAAFDSGVFEKRKSDLQATIAIFEKTLAPKLEAKISNSEQVKVNIEKAATTCREVTNKIALLDLTTAHLEAAKPMIEKVRSAALEQASFMRLSPEAQAKLKERITKISYMLPLTSAERLERIRLSLVKDIASTQDSIDWSDKHTPQDTALMLAQAVSNGDSNEVSGSPERICQTQAPSSLSDFALSGQGQVSLSWQSVKYPKIGFPVLAHEFGHVISSVVNDLDSKRASYDLSAYHATKGCTTLRHGALSGAVPTDEEDFADAFSAAIMKRLGFNKPTHPNLGCALLSKDQNRYGTSTGLTLVNPKEFPDKHSSHFYRMIQYEIDIDRKLSASCQKIVDQYAPQMNRTCN